jgi:hypothetical protein
MSIVLIDLSGYIVHSSIVREYLLARTYISRRREMRSSCDCCDISHDPHIRPPDSSIESKENDVQSLIQAAAEIGIVLRRGRIVLVL